MTNAQKQLLIAAQGILDILKDEGIEITKSSLAAGLLSGLLDTCKSRGIKLTDDNIINLTTQAAWAAEQLGI